MKRSNGHIPQSKGKPNAWSAFPYLSLSWSNHCRQLPTLHKRGGGGC